MMHRDYFNAGFRIFGLHGTTKGVCDCGDVECEAILKHPRVSNWQHTPSWSDTQFDVMEMTGQFKTGFGVLCDGYLIIDIDPRNGGNDGYKKLVADTGIDYKEDAGFVVATGGGGWHIYYKHSGAEKLNSHLKEYKGIDFKSSGFVVGAGSWHKSGNMYEVQEGFADEVTELPKPLFDLLVKRIEVNKGFSVSPDVITETQVKELLSYVKNDNLDYDTWIEIGMIIHESLGVSAFDVWFDWSATSPKHNPKQMDHKWHSFGKNQNKKTIGSLIHMAKENGYSEPVTFETTLTYDIDLLNTNDIDLKKAPGITGDFIDFINANSRYPRESLAVSAALSTLSNIAGMRFEDEEYGVTPNIFCFNVAGSATGKEAIQQASNDLMCEAGIGKAIYGKIKSEQEIYRNAIRNQLIGYMIDEFGITLGNIQQASKGAGASYLGGVIGSLMSIYSKANGKMPLGADFAESLIRETQTQIAAINKLIDENEAKEYHYSKLESLQNIYQQLNDGYIESPFLTLSGYTTPTTFHGLVTYAQATNGFIGRALLFEEKNNNPVAKDNFKKQKISDALSHKIKMLRTGGNFDMLQAPRVEYNKEKTVIHTSNEAKELLKNIQLELHGKAAHAMETNGLEAIVRRAFELVLKVSMLLAIGCDNVREVEHVRWAYALIKLDLENKINLTGANMAEQEKNLATEILSKVKHKLDKTTGTTIGIIANKLRTIKKDDIQKALDYLVENGEIIPEEKKQKRGPAAIVYYLV